MKILTVISCFNEEKAIRDTIADIINNSTVKSDILVIDNSSDDSSLSIIKELKVNYLAHPANTGGSSGVIKTALAYAYYHNYDIYCHMDGDNQHYASQLNKLIKPIIEGSTDIVIGSRFLNKKGYQSHFIRRQGITLFSRILTWITGYKLTDITSGFRAYNRKAINYYANNYKHEMEACIQMLLVGSYAGLKIQEVPIEMKPRNTGKSEINFKNAIKFPVYGTITLIGTVIQKHNQNVTIS